MLRRGINPLRKRVTFFIDRGSKDRPLRLTVSWWVLLVFSLAVLGLVGEGGRFLVCGVANLIGRCKIAHLENIKQKILKKYALLEENADSLKNLVVEMDLHDYEIRTTNNFEILPLGERMLGVGGPDEESGEMQELYSLGSSSFKRVSKLDKAVAELARRTRFQEESFSEIDRKLGEQKTNLDRTPSVMPTKGYFSSSFGARVDPFEHRTAIHSGLDIADREGKQGIPVMASAEGTCIFVGPDAGYGLCIRINHGNGIETLYGHLSRAYVWAGDKVKRFQVIGTTGSSGRATGPHLHYEIRVSGIPVDPKGYFIEDDTDGMILDYLDSIPVPVTPVPYGDSYMQLYQNEITPAADQKPDSGIRLDYGRETIFWGDALSVRDGWSVPE